MSISGSSDPAGERPPEFSPVPAHAQRHAAATRCWPGTPVVLFLGGLAALLVAGGLGHAGTPLRTVCGLAVVAVLVIGAGLIVLQPNEARVLILFGRYTGTVDVPGLWLVNPLTVFGRRKVSLRIHNFQGDGIKVNDAAGNPIEIAAVIVWRVRDTARAVFDVQDFERFVTVQSEVALRHLANQFPYDDYDSGRMSLRGSAEEIRGLLQIELQDRLGAAGVEVLEARLTHLAYAPEIAEVMLRRQQAEAVVAARRTMVDGAVGLVHMALARLADSDLVELDPERKAAMVANLMVVLSGDRSPSPVINTGTLYS